MESHAFRVMGEELLTLLNGARVEKIHGPAPGVVVLLLFADGEKRRLVLRYGQQHPLLFFSAQAPANPSRPTSLVMRLRKYASGRRLGAGVMDFALRAFAFPILEGGSIVRYLLLDLRQGPAIFDTLPEGFGREPAWPDARIVDQCCNKPWDKRETSGPWQVYSVLTPLLRETLAALDHMEGRALMADLHAGGQGLFVYADATRSSDGEGQAGPPAFYCAWPLPDAIAAQRHGVFLYNTFDTVSPYPSLEAVSLVDSVAFFNTLAEEEARPENKEEAQEKRRLKRLLAKLAQEEKRLQDMLSLREDACLLQANLWRFLPDEKVAEVSLSSVAEDEGGISLQPEQVRCIQLDPLLTVRENVQRMFHQSARGSRGLSLLKDRRKGLEDELAGRSTETVGMAMQKTFSGAVKGLERRTAGQKQPGGKVKSGDAKKQRELKNIAVFRSSEGYTMLRGKNASGNHALLKVAQPYDLWLHARGGPSAHLIIRRAHAADDVPEQTLLEAAALVGSKSWQRNDAKADIMVAYVKHVHPVKGAAPGTVRVDMELHGLTVSLEGIVEEPVATEI